MLLHCTTQLQWGSRLISAGTLFLLADPSIREDELALTLDYRCYRVDVHDDASYCSNFAGIIECIIKTIPETTTDIMELTSAARRAYVTGLPAADQPISREFDESRSAKLPAPPLCSAPPPTLTEFRYVNHPHPQRRGPSRGLSLSGSSPPSSPLAHTPVTRAPAAVSHGLGCCLCQAVTRQLNRGLERALRLLF